MAFDGITVAAVVHELNDTIAGGRVDKVYQPEQDEIIILIRSKGRNLRLLLSADASNPRIHLTEKSKDNPMQAPMFCMVLRKHLTGGRVVSVEQPDFERIVNITIESLNEMGDMTAKTLTIEIMGKHSNIILTGEKGVILDAIKHVPHSVSSVRQVMPGRLLETAPSQNRLNPLTSISEASAPLHLSYTGISRATADELAHRAAANETGVFFEFRKLMADVMAGNFKNEVVLDEKNRSIEFAPFELTRYGGEQKRQFAAASEMVEYYYGRRDTAARAGQKSQDLRRLVQLNIDRCLKKREIQANTLKDIENRDTLRLCGELLTSSIYLLKKGMDSFTTANFYDDNNNDITIALDPNKTPSENAQAYFRKYNKQKRTFDALQAQIAQNDAELDYLESVLAALLTSEDEADINEIRDELAEQGFVRAKRRREEKGGQKSKKSKPLLFKSTDGFDIYVGKNNRQNDELTLKFAASDDIWLHTKNIPGSHVVIRLDGRSVSDTAVMEAAGIAAFFSKAKNGSNVPVDYTQRRNVKKPGGAKPGFVIYDKYKTVYITPDAAFVNNQLNSLKV